MRAEYPCLASVSPSPRVSGPLCDLFGWGEAAAGIAGAVATTAAAKMQADAAREAAKISADAATHGADLQDAAAQRTEAFQRQQADYSAQQQEVDRRANYGQYAANRRRIGSLGTMLGLGGVEVPDYVPGIVPHYTNAPAPGAPPGPAGSPAPPDLQSPANFGTALAGGTRAAAAIAPPGGAPPGDPRVMTTPQLQPDGTYAMVPSMPPYRTFGQSMGVA